MDRSKYAFEMNCPCGCGMRISSPDGNRVSRKLKSHLVGMRVLCQCGKCNQTVSFYDSVHSRVTRYVRGHQWIGRTSPKRGRYTKDYSERKLCECGKCNTMILKYNPHSGVENHYVQGHQLRGKSLSREHREKLSDSVSRNLPVSTKTHYCVPTRYNGILFRGYYESCRAKELDQLGYHWAYQPKHLSYFDENGQRHNYHPDFWVDELQRYEEVKGYIRDRDIQKMRLIRSQYPQIRFVVLTRPRGMGRIEDCEIISV